MVGAVLSHLFLIGGSPVPALVLLCFAAIILRGRFGTVKAWLGTLAGPAVLAPEPASAATNSSQRARRWWTGD